MEPKPRALLRPVLSGYFCFHLAAITVANLPPTTAFGPSLHAPFAWYVNLAGLWQGWDMFTTIPRFLDLDGTLLSRNADGVETRVGPILPGLTPYGKEDRIDGTFLRLAFASDDYPGYAPRYLAAVCKALREETGKTPASVAFELRTQQLRSLPDVRKDGRLAEDMTFRFGPAACVP
jgi:hypothetical protein